MNKKITFVGMGPGAKECLTLEGLAHIRQSANVLSSRRLYELIKDENPKAQFIELPSHTQEAFKVIEALKEQELTILVSGDVGLFSMAQSLKVLLVNCECRFLSGLSSVQVAFSRLGEEWSQNKVYSLHGRELLITSDKLQEEEVFTLLCGTREAQNQAQDIYEKLKDNFLAWGFVDLTLPSEKILSLHQINLKEVQVYSRLLLIFKKRKQV